MTPLQHFVYSALVTSVTTFFLSVLVYLTRKKSNVNRSFALYSLSISFWSLFVYFHGSASTPNQSLLFARILNVGAISIPVFFFHFLLIYLQLTYKKSKQILLVFCYVLWFSFLLLDFTNLFIPSVRVAPPLHYLMVAGPAYHAFVAFFFIMTIYSISLLLKALRESRGVKKTQLSYFFASSSFGYFGGINNFLILYDLHLPLFFPYGSYAVPIYVLIATFIILKYRFMDIEVIIKRTLVFAGLLAFVFGIFSFGLFITQEVLAVYFGFKWELALGISLFLIVLGYEPMRAFLINTTDRYLFQKKYDYQKVLKDAATGIAQIESLQRLLGLVTHFLTMRIRVKNAAVVTRDLGTSDFRLGYERGYPAERRPAEKVPATSALIRYLDQEKEGIEIERVKESIETGGPRPKKGEEAFFRPHDFTEIKRQMEELHAACCIPSFLGKELRNILVLGEKKSGDYYSQEDLNVLFTLAQQSAIAIENARLYDEAINKSKELEKINEELESAKVRLVHALEETEKANKQLQDTQAQLIHEQKMATLGRLAASVGHEVNNPLTILSMNVSRAIMKHRKDPGLKVTDVADLFQKMEQNIGRIKAVVNTLTGLLKKSEKGKFEPLSLKLLLEETLPLVQFQTYLENPSQVEVEINIPSSTPLVKGDLERLQEVFLNLFINAYHAMAGRRKPKIVVEAHPLNNGQKMVEVDFSDNGSGMPEEVQKKIFTYGFTTKGPGRGSGMGLYICKYIIELHGGDIKVKSDPGRGTTFVLTLPIYEEPSQVGMITGESSSV